MKLHRELDRYLNNYESVLVGQQFRDVFDKNPVVQLIINPKTGGIIYSNTAAEEFYGYSKKVMARMNIDEINTLPRKEIMKQMLDALNTTKNHFCFQHRLASGEIRDVDVYSGPIETLGKMVLFSVIHDITNRKKMEKDLCNEKQKLANILVGTNTGCWEWKIPTGELIITEMWANIIGYTIEEISPISINTWTKFIHPEDLIQSNNLLSNYFKGETHCYVFEGRMKHKNGNWIWIIVRGKVHEWDNSGHPIFMSGTHQDISEQKQIVDGLKKDYLEMQKTMSNQLINI